MPTPSTAFVASPIAISSPQFSTPFTGSNRCLALPICPSPKRVQPVCAQQPPQPREEKSYPGFLRDSDDDSIQPRTSFFDIPSAPTVPTTPNERVMLQVRATMDQLGIKDDDDARKVPQRKPKTIQEMAGINPLSPLAGSAGAAVMSAAAWRMLLATVNFAALHPMDDRVYIVQRVSVVIRTTLVCLFALGSGISGVTAIGLFLMGLRLAYAKLSGELNNSVQQSKGE